MRTLIRIAIALERIGDLLSQVVDYERGSLRMNDIDRAKVYSEHLGKKLTEPPR